MRVFNALNGEEFKKIVVKEVERALDSDGEFRRHIAFPMIRWSWKLEMRIYPRDPEEKTVETGGEMAVEAFNPDGRPSEKVVISTEERVVDTPDVAREEAGIPVPDPTPAGPQFARRAEVGTAARNPLVAPRLNRE